MADTLRITVQEVKERMDAGEEFTFVDVRNPQAWAESESKIPGAVRVSLKEVEAQLPEIPKDRPVVAYCT